ncbi:MAG: FHA domain-containing protein [Armatimonadota bacterium]|nr:FHA domain-containing protein [bacterium]
MIRILRYTIAGMLGAIFAWGMMEWTPLMPDDGSSISYGAIVAIGLVAGLMIGLMLGVAEGLSGLSPRDAAKSIGLGAIVGAAGGMVGLAMGNAFYNAMCRMAYLGETVNSASGLPPGPMSFVLLLIGRGFGWALIGLFIGLSQGIATFSTKKMVNGAVGGFIGGGLGGSVFEILAWMNQGGSANFPPEMIRFISFSITGGAIGLFIGFIEEVAKQAWLVRLVGRNEGKEYTLYKQITTIGRSEMVDIPVFTDPDVSERHAAISVQGKRYSVEDLGSAYGTKVDGRAVTKEALRDGDIIEIGKTRFLFKDKASAPRYVQPAAPVYDGSVQIPSSQHICPFCGSIKDVNGNCECSVGSKPPTQNQQTVQQPVQPPVQHQPVFFGEPDHTQPVAPQPAPPAQGARLTAMSGPYAGRVFTLGSGQTDIGRDAAKLIGLPDDNTVSRNHARIAQEVTCYVIYDAGSTNGTFVNGNRIQRQELKLGDMVQIGNTKFRFEA